MPKKLKLYKDLPPDYSNQIDAAIVASYDSGSKIDEIISDLEKEGILANRLEILLILNSDE